jgi:hypothetical protein
LRFGNSIILPEVGSSPATPPSGGLVLFAKSSDSRFYYKNDAGVEYGPIDAIPTNLVTTDTTQTIAGLKTFSSFVNISVDNPLSGTANTASALTIGTRAGMFSAAALGVYLTDNTYYNGTQWIARNTTTDGSSYLNIGTSGLQYYSYTTATTAGTAATPTQRFRITPGGSGTLYGNFNATGTVQGSGGVLDGSARVYSSNNLVPVAGISATGTPGATNYLRGDGSWVANLVTTDTAQTISGIKTFSAAPVFPAASITIANIAATGTTDSTTYLRGDGTWAVVTSGGGTAANVVTSATATANKLTVTAAASPPATTSAGDIWVVSDATATPDSIDQTVVNKAVASLDPILVREGKAMTWLTPNMPPARTTTPTITFGINSVDAATPVQILPNTSTTGTALNPVFKLSGNATYMAGGTVYPDYQSIRQTPLPSNPATYGRAAVDFMSDAPAISFKHYRSQGGYTRISVDGVEQMMIGPAVISGTAAAGTTNSITFAAGANAANGYYLGHWIHIISGTGAGQYAQISAYTGSTRVATVTPNWTTTPDATSVYEVTQQRLQYTNTTNLSGVDYYFKFDWNGERRFRHYRVEEDSQGFWGCWVPTALDTVYPSVTADGRPTIWCGDSFGAGTGANLWMGGLAKIACDTLGWGLINISVGGTGFLNIGPQSLTFRDRLLPPTNAWQIFTRTATGGTFTLTQNSITTAAISYTATLAQIQTILDNAFGAGAFKTAGQDAQSFFIIGTGTNASYAGAMTANWTSMTGGPQYLVRYLGDLYPNIPKDGSGNPIDFNLVLQGLHNDTTYNNAAWTNAVLQAEVDYVVQSLTNKYPTMDLYMIGMMYLPGSGATDPTLNAANTVGLNSMTNYARRINGKVPFVNTLNPSWATGSGYPGALAGNGNSDILTWTDGVHPSPYGHYMYGSRIAQSIMSIVASE